MTLSHGDSETRLARERVIELLDESDFGVVVEGVDREDGWRGEFLRRRERDDIVLLAHKPAGAPYVSLGCLVGVDRLFGRDAAVLSDAVLVVDDRARFPTLWGFGLVAV